MASVGPFTQVHYPESDGKPMGETEPKAGMRPGAARGPAVFFRLEHALGGSSRRAAGRLSRGPMVAPVGRGRTGREREDRF
jgi:hypothetical protein